MQDNFPILAHLGHHGLHLIGHLCLGKNQIQLHRILVAVNNGIGKAPRFLGQLQQDAGDLVLLIGAQNANLIVQLHHTHGLDKHRGAAGGGVVDQAGNLPAELRFDRHHVTSAPLGDDALLKVLLVGRGADQLVQLFPHPLGSCTDLPANSRQRGRGIIRHFFLIDDTHEDFFL